MPKLFVIMPFGIRSAAPEHGVAQIDFDLVYRELIRKAGEECGWQVGRIDESVGTGHISDQYLRELFSAELVLADISVPNGNVFYELGVRQAISSAGTLLIASEHTRLPFDISAQRVLFYQPTPNGLIQSRGRIVEAIRAYSPSAHVNPVNAFLIKLGLTSSPTEDEVVFEQDLRGRIERAKNVDQLVAVWRWAQHLSPLPASPLLLLAERLSDYGEWAQSVEVLRAAVKRRPNDFEVNRQLGWHLRHLGSGFEDEAMSFLIRALELNPSDPETLGMAGGLRKRQKRYSEAMEFYAKGTRISPKSLYMRVNEAALAILSHPTAAHKGVVLYRQLLQDIANEPNLAADAWAELVLVEANFATGNDAESQQHIERATQLSATPSALRSAGDQIRLLGEVGFRSEQARTLVDSLFAKAASAGQASSIQIVSSGKPAPLSVNPLPVLIHLSDLHFGTRLQNGKSVDMHRFFDGEYNKPLSKHLFREFLSAQAHFKYAPERLHLVISGDITYTAEPAEFKRVIEFLNETCASLNINKERVHLVPGNHDINWHSAKANQSNRFDHYIGFLVDFYGEALFRKRYPLIKWDLKFNTSRPAPHEIVSVYSGDGITLVGLNSCVYETDQEHYGFIGGNQLGHLADLLDEYAPAKNTVRVALMHHHLHPFPEALMHRREGEEVWMDLSTIRDAGLVERRLERLNFDLVLHGHKHKPQIRETLVFDRHEPLLNPSRLFVCGAGSTGVSSSELEHNDANHYQVVEILCSPRAAGTSFLRVEWRELALSAEAEWSTRGTWTLLG